MNGDDTASQSATTVATAAEREKEAETESNGRGTAVESEPTNNDAAHHAEVADEWQRVTERLNRTQTELSSLKVEVAELKANLAISQTKERAAVETPTEAKELLPPDDVDVNPAAKTSQKPKDHGLPKLGRRSRK